mgnify:CR=1 FL=1
MRTLFSLFCAACLFYVLGWFITFQKDPYENCIDHPDEVLTEEYYLCEPFGFTIKKGLIENHNPAIKRNFTGDKRKRLEE